jgi:enamine deaminase RidA (YjgF/YER057c/UK114 family)
MTTDPAAPRARYLNPPTIHEPRGYTHVVEVLSGRPVYIAGQVAMDPEGNLVGPGDLRAQTHQVFANLRAALEAVGATFSDVVKFNYYVLDASQASVVREVRDAYIDPDHRPASTLVQVGRLFAEDYLIEVEAVALLPA